MYTYKIIVGLVLITSLFVSTTKVIAKPLEISTQTSNLTLKEQVDVFSEYYKIDSNLIKKIVKCESQWNINAVSDKGLSRGIAQFQEPTFYWLSKKMGLKLNYDSSFDQLKLLTWSVANGYGRNWTAYRTIKNGGKYSFYSRQLKKHFTTYCK